MEQGEAVSPSEPDGPRQEFPLRWPVLKFIFLNVALYAIFLLLGFIEPYLREYFGWRSQRGDHIFLFYIYNFIALYILTYNNVLFLKIFLVKIIPVVIFFALAGIGVDVFLIMFIIWMLFITLPTIFIFRSEITIYNKWFSSLTSCHILTILMLLFFGASIP